MERNNCSKLPSYWYWLTAIWHDFASQIVEFQVLLKQQQHTGPSSNKCTCFHSSSFCCFFESAGDTPPFCCLWPPRKLTALQNEAVVNCCHYSLHWSSSRYVISVYHIMFLCAHPFCLHFSIFVPARHSKSVIFVMPSQIAFYLLKHFASS